MRGTMHRAGEPEPVAVAVSLEAGAVVARSDDGRRFAIPLAEVDVSAGGFDGDFIFCRTPDGGSTIATNDPNMDCRLVGPNVESQGLL